MLCAHCKELCRSHGTPLILIPFVIRDTRRRGLEARKRRSPELPDTRRGTGSGAGASAGTCVYEDEAGTAFVPEKLKSSCEMHVQDGGG